MKFVAVSPHFERGNRGILVFQDQNAHPPKIFSGKKDEVYAYDTDSGRTFLVGLGAQADFTADGMRLAAYNLLK
ncbi:MAG: hypothetical protein LBD99_02125, partial [Candidatus Margulisbacteria bacterium]|nr:hypothetical protein [Candidatus Margulisiibacteriota bacterium]